MVPRCGYGSLECIDACPVAQRGDEVQGSIEVECVLDDSVWAAVRKVDLGGDPVQERGEEEAGVVGHHRVSGVLE